MAISLTLAGLTEGDEGWELGMAQATFRASANGVVGVAGAPAAVLFRDRSDSACCAFSISAGEEFTVESPAYGARVYVAFRETDTIRPPIRLDRPPESVLRRDFIRVVAGPQAEMFDLTILDRSFSVSMASDRVGLRLAPPTDPHQIELVSEPMCVGAVQVTNDGTLIVIGPDGPTIGGYPKIAVAASCDLARLGQLRAADPLRFELVTVDEARRLGAIASGRILQRHQEIKLGLSV